MPLDGRLVAGDLGLFLPEDGEDVHVTSAPSKMLLGVDLMLGMVVRALSRLMESLLRLVYTLFAEIPGSLNAGNGRQPAWAVSSGNRRASAC